MVLGLFVHVLRTVESHREVVETTLGDFAAFGAERIARELDRTFTTVLLDYTAVAREAHYAFTAGLAMALPPEGGTTAGEVASRDPVGGPVLPEGMIDFYFSLGDSGLVSHGPAPDPRTRRWIVDEVTGHLPIYPPPAPYVVLRSTGASAIVYRKEEAYGREAVFGFVLALDAAIPLYRDIVLRTPLLPRSLDDDTADPDLFEASVHLSPSEPALFAQESPDARGGPVAWAFAPKAGRLAARVRIDAERARSMVAGDAATGSLALLVALAVITTGLIYLAMTLSRRSARVAEMRESFIANVSHDLRTPITQIRMFAETLGLGRLDRPEERDRALRIIGRQTEVLENLVDNLLHASGSRPPITPVPSDVSALVREAVEALEPLAGERHCSIDVTGPEELEVAVDRMAVTRILTNLLDNAIRHGVEGGRIVVRVDRTDGLTLRVEDSGPGIPERDRDRVLDRFERGSRAGHDTTGVGVGLSVVRDLATRHGGGVRIEKREGGGTVVVVTLDAPAASVPPVDGRATP